MFARLPDTIGEDVPIVVDGAPCTVRAGDTVAAALIANGVMACRTTPTRAAPRGPFCLMGMCFDCLVTIDGRRDMQGCAVRVRAGMCIETQRGAVRVTDAP